MEFLKVANGVPMLVICTLIIVLVLFQPIIMSVMARKRAVEIGLTDEEIKKAVKSTAIFSFIPSIPAIVGYLVLIPALGKYIPWMRLSVVGSVAYEGMVADQAATAFGYDLTKGDFPIDVFLAIFFIMNIGIIGGNLFNIFFLKSYDSGVKKIMSRNAALVPIITGAVFVTLYGVFSARYITNIENPVSLITFLGAAGIALAVNGAAKKHPKLKEHAFSISLIAGMIIACVASPFFS
ncbi:DUF5058 family protein [Enterococcus sp. BWR-S5]|uniref:DUF5058 family protein n=1 Tax=Enterococcus sp. BWR-S5 TaxID=2787714 RepID=UPI00192066C1|nr:DUF5058 family protein [Enterococcus sp. BWR-S5]MBL1226712.1 DUF5058 family protein [Enterococcus sp. BWR-S5]